MQLDGSGSSDSDGSIAIYQWTDGTSTIASVAKPTVKLGVGAHLLTLEVTDDRGGSATDEVAIEVRPVIELGEGPSDSNEIILTPTPRTAADCSALPGYLGRSPVIHG